MQMPVQAPLDAAVLESQQQQQQHQLDSSQTYPVRACQTNPRHRLHFLQSMHSTVFLTALAHFSSTQTATNTTGTATTHLLPTAEAKEIGHK